MIRGRMAVVMKCPAVMPVPAGTTLAPCLSVRTGRPIELPVGSEPIVIADPAHIFDLPFRIPKTDADRVHARTHPSVSSARRLPHFNP
jgi:hypothetical protein